MSQPATRGIHHVTGISGDARRDRAQLDVDRP